MLKLKEKSISAYKGDYRPVEILKNNQKIHGFQTTGMLDNDSIFENTYNDEIAVYGKSGYVQAKNLCPPPITKSGGYNDSNFWQITATENGNFNVDGVMILGAEITKATLEAGVYTISGCSYCAILWKDRETFLPIPATITLDKQTEVEVYLWYTSTQNLSLRNQYIQIEKGEQASDYTPYVGDVYSPPSPENYRPLVSSGGTVRCEGGNLLSPGFVDANRWILDVDSTTTNSKKFDLDLQPGKYVFSFENKPLTTYIFLYLQKSNDEWQTITTINRPIMNSSIINNFQFEVEEGYRYRFWSWRLEGNFDLFYNWQIRRISTPNKFYPPHDPVILKIPELRGIKVEEAVNSNYSESTQDGIVYYISDKLIKNKIIRSVGETILNGTETVTEKEIDSTEIGCYYLDFSDYFKINRCFDFGICNYFNIIDAQTENSVGMALGIYDKNLYLFLNKADFPNAGAVSDWLKEKYEEGKPLTVLYPLDKEITESAGLEDTLKAFPDFTRLTVSKEEGMLALGMAKCIKTQML